MLRRLTAALLCALVLVEGAGVARGFGRGTQVRCCCGTHASARRCKCKACPIAMRREGRVPAHDGLAAGQSCAEQGDEAVLAVVALPARPFGIVLVAPPPARAERHRIGPPPRGHALELPRPPP